MLSTQELQTLLLSNGGSILDNVSPEQIENYSYIKHTLQEEDIHDNSEFQERFNQLHKFKRRRIKPGLRKRFYELLEKQKDKKDIHLRKLSGKLFGIRPKRYRPKHFSMLTQLVHTVREDYPIYDKNIAELHEYRPPRSKRMPVYRKINKYMDFYNHVVVVNRDLLANNKLYSLLRALELKFKSHKEVLSPAKRLDLLMRSAGELKRNDELLVTL